MIGGDKCSAILASRVGNKQECFQDLGGSDIASRDGGISCAGEEEIISRVLVRRGDSGNTPSEHNSVDKSRNFLCQV